MTNSKVIKWQFHKRLIQRLRSNKSAQCSLRQALSMSSFTSQSKIAKPQGQCQKKKKKKLTGGWQVKQCSLKHEMRSLLHYETLQQGHFFILIWANHCPFQTWQVKLNFKMCLPVKKTKNNLHVKISYVLCNLWSKNHDVILTSSSLGW